MKQGYALSTFRLCDLTGHVELKTVRPKGTGVRIPQAQSTPRGTEYSRYLRREEMSALIYTEAERLAQFSPRAAYPSSVLRGF